MTVLVAVTPFERERAGEGRQEDLAEALVPVGRATRTRWST